MSCWSGRVKKKAVEVKASRDSHASARQPFSATGERQSFSLRPRRRLRWRRRTHLKSSGENIGSASPGGLRTSGDRDDVQRVGQERQNGGDNIRNDEDHEKPEHQNKTSPNDGGDGGFRVTVRALQRLVEAKAGKGRMRVLESLGGVKALAEALRVDLDVGLNTEDRTDLAKRASVFGSNEVPPRPLRSFVEILIDALKDDTLRVLLAAGALSLGLELNFNATDTLVGPTLPLYETIIIYISRSCSSQDSAWRSSELTRRINVTRDERTRRAVSTFRSLCDGLGRGSIDTWRGGCRGDCDRGERLPEAASV